MFPLSWVFLYTKSNPERFLAIEVVGAAIGVVAIVASGYLADRIGRRTLLGASAAAIAVFSGFAPQLLAAGELGEVIFMVLGFALLGISFGQSSGVVASEFTGESRYTGAALTSDIAWLVGAGFAPLVALFLSSHFGLVAGGAYLLSGSLATLLALWLNKELASRT